MRDGTELLYAAMPRRAFFSASSSFFARSDRNAVLVRLDALQHLGDRPLDHLRRIARILAVGGRKRLRQRARARS